MKPAPFEYWKAQSVEQVIEWLAEWGESAKILAGGQSLLPMMKLRLARPEHLIDINGIASLSQIEEDEHSLKIGALVRHHQFEESIIVRKRCPILAEAAGLIGHPQIRHRGTIGGSLCHADPCAELPTVLTALEAEVVVQGPLGSEKKIGAGDFFLSYLTTALGEAELLTGVIVPTLTPQAGWSFLEMTDVDGGLAVVCVAAILEMDSDRVCRKARVALGGVASTPVRVGLAEEFLEGKLIEDGVIDGAAEVVVSAIEPESDMLHTADHKKAVAGALTRRAIVEAAQRAQRGLR
jgi:carbon-monoxide dehydrogenase medium subunit